MEAILWLVLGVVISSYGTRHSVLIPHGIQVTANLPCHLQPGFLLVNVLFFSHLLPPWGELLAGRWCGWLLSGLDMQRWNRS